MSTGLRAIMGTAAEPVDRSESDGATEEPKVPTSAAPAVAQVPVLEQPYDESSKESASVTSEAEGEAGGSPEPGFITQQNLQPSQAKSGAGRHGVTRRVGTLDQPYMRQRDNQPTRKVGVVLPVELAERMQIHCVQRRIRPNSFIEQAILAALQAAERRAAKVR